jgi:tryptophan synthase alpha chain
VGLTARAGDRAGPPAPRESRRAGGAGTEAIAAAFAGDGRRAALMPYMMGGFPDVATSRRIAEAYADGGADLVELGVPFSDPLADGPVIHAAATAALRAGATTHEVLAIGRALAERVPVVAMVYANLVMARGLERFVDDLAAHGVSGLIVPDLPLEESDAVGAACEAAGLALVPLVAPTTPDERMARIGARARGFLYAVSVTGTTGERVALADAFAAIVRRAKACTEVPVALGFGIGTPEQAREAADAGADGVIVGSRLVRAAAEAQDDAPAAIHALVAQFAQALR